MIKILKEINCLKVTLAICSLLIISVLFSCRSSNKINSDYLYFQTGSDTASVQKKETVIHPYDVLSIQVFSRTLNQEQAAIFNIPTNANISSTSTSGTSNSSGTGTTTAGQGYEVNAGGTIEMPVIGTVKAAGLTKDQLQAVLIEKITNYVKNPTVIVRFSEFNVNVLGEVRAPGVKKFTQDKVTLIDAITAAGDLTDFAKREDITVIREQNSKKRYYKVDLRTKDIFSSPVYMLQPNDIVYVEPNKNKLRTLAVNTETQRKIGLYTSFLGIALTLVSLFIYLRR